VQASVIDPPAGERIALPSAGDLAASLPVRGATGELVSRTRQAIRDAIHGRDRERLLVIVGPCSIHSTSGALAYARSLVPVIDRTADRLIVVMRTYFEKPRSTLGWKGLIHDPNLDGSFALDTGIARARALLRDINDLGVPCASELLDPILAPYLSDLLSWVAIGARTSESQLHRELASGLELPVGFKNSTAGSIDVALNAMVSAARPHTTAGLSHEGAPIAYRTAGNPDTHLVLRGGRSGPNYFLEHMSTAIKEGRRRGISRPLLIDCSHDNSGFDPKQQVNVCREVQQLRSQVGSGLLGVQLESHLRGGRQDWSPDRIPSHDQSITDPCMSWEETEPLLDLLADMR